MAGPRERASGGTSLWTVVLALVVTLVCTPVCVRGTWRLRPVRLAGFAHVEPDGLGATFTASPRPAPSKAATRKRTYRGAV